MTPAGKILNSTVLLRSLKPVALKLQGPSESPRRLAKTQLVGPRFLLFPLLYPGCCTHSITRIQPITSAESPVSTGSSTLLSRPLFSPSSCNRTFFSRLLQPSAQMPPDPLSLSGPICQRAMITVRQGMIQGLETVVQCQMWEGLTNSLVIVWPWWALPLLRRWSHHQLHK